MRRRGGFTLIEVLVALAIAAFGLTALFTTVNQSVRASLYLREKTFANWIAHNRIAEVRLSGQMPSDETTGTVEFAGQTWRWEVRTFETEVEDIVRLEARAAPEEAPEDSWPGFATGFMGADIAQPTIVSPFTDQIAPGGRRGVPRGGGPRQGGQRRR